MAGRDRDIPIASHAPVRSRAMAYGNSYSPRSEKENDRKVVTVEGLLHWAYAREKVHLARMPGLGASAVFAARGFAGVASSERVGAAVGSSMNLGFEAPADAYAAHYAVEAQGKAARLVREYAIIGARPDWTPCPAIRTVPGKTRYNAAGKLPIFCEVSYTGDFPEHVAERRKRYAQWAQAIASVYASLMQTELRQHALAPDLPPLAPWA